MKKVEYDTSRGEWNVVFSAEGFLRQAKGPLAGFFQSRAPSSSDWQQLLAVPREATPESRAELESWVGRYVAVRRSELGKGAETEAEFPEFAPYADWAEQIRDDWRDMLGRFTNLSQLSEEQRKQAADAFKKREVHLADFLAQESLAIQDYQHSLWRLEKAAAEGGADEIPFRQERLAQKRAETDREPLPWVAEVSALREALADDLEAVLTAEQASSSLADRAEEAVRDPQQRSLDRMNIFVTWFTIGVGACLLVGLFTPLAAVGAALFLLSVMATQPPWVAGANTMFFYYQLVEFAALILVAATSAGRYGGLDAIIHGLWSKRRSSRGA